MKHLNGRQTFAYLLLLVLIIPTLAACVGTTPAAAPTAAPAPPTAAPSVGHALRIAETIWPDTLAPQKAVISTEIAVLILNEVGVQQGRYRDHLPPARRPHVQRRLAAHGQRFRQGGLSHARPAQPRRLPDLARHDHGRRRGDQHRGPD